MSEGTVYTIGRQYGSGGRYVGRKLADKLGIPFYDKELVAMAAKESGLSEALFQNADEKASSSLFYSLAVGSYPLSGGAAFGATEMPLNDQLFLIVSQTIKKLADEGSCVIIGRCADYILRERKNMMSVFIHAPIEARVERAVKYYKLEGGKAAEICLRNDKKRANFYNYYSDKKWGMCRTYDLSLDSSKLGIDGCVDQIIGFEKAWKGYWPINGKWWNWPSRERPSRGLSLPRTRKRNGSVAFGTGVPRIVSAFFPCAPAAMPGDGKGRTRGEGSRPCPRGAMARWGCGTSIGSSMPTVPPTRK